MGIAAIGVAVAAAAPAATDDDDVELGCSIVVVVAFVTEVIVSSGIGSRLVSNRDDVELL